MTEHSRVAFFPTGVVTYSFPSPGFITKFNVAVVAVSRSSSIILAVTVPM